MALSTSHPLLTQPEIYGKTIFIKKADQYDPSLFDLLEAYHLSKLQYYTLEKSQKKMILARNLNVKTKV